MHMPLAPVLLAACLSAAPVSAEPENGIRFKGAQAFYEFGSIMKGVELSTDTITNQWVQRFGGTFDLEAKRGDHLGLYFGTGSIFWHAVPLVEGNSAAKVFYGDAILTKAYTQFTFGDAENPALTGNLGFIPVKYGNARNLGEYLFRTGTYPGFIVTGNGYTAVNTTTIAVLGTRWSQSFANGLSHDLFITSERQSYPLHDLSLTYLAQYKGGFLNAGLGIQFDRLIPVKPSITTPTEEKNTWFEYQGRKLANNPEYYQLLATGATHDGRTADAARWNADKALVDSLRKVWETDASGRPKLNKYSFQGIKPLAMLSLDFKSLFGEGLFRNDEMMLYSEAALMGWENRPIYYENRMDRVVAMIGFNIPAFGLLDNFNVELERCASPFVNGYRNAREGNIPLPDYNYDQINGYDPEDWHGDDWKWSVYLGRKIIDGFQVQAQAASDHLRGRRYTRVVSENSLLVDKPDWYYAIKLVASL